MLTVHVGLHKTGSTSIQTVLGLERGHIRRRQVYLRWHDLFVGDGQITTRNVARIVSLSQRGWHVVVSSEGALGSMPLAYPRAKDVAAQLAQLFRDIPLQVVIYLRPHTEWAASALGQHRREGGATEPDAFARDLLASPGFHHAALVRDLSDALPTVGLIVRPYAVQMDIVEDFFVGCDLGPVPPAFVGLRANRSGGGPSDSPSSPFSADVQEALLRHFRTDWDALLTDRLPAVEQARGDLLQLLEGEVRAPSTPSEAPIESAAAEPGPAGGRPRHASRLRATSQKHVWTLRHGPRQLLLGGLVARDARRGISAPRTVPGDAQINRELEQAQT